MSRADRNDRILADCPRGAANRSRAIGGLVGRHVPRVT
jgi:hypothetical protein